MDVDRLKEIPVEKEVERQSNKIKNNFYRVKFFCVLSILTPFSSIFAENYELFFARSGSLIVVFFILSEIECYKNDDLMMSMDEKGKSYINQASEDKLKGEYNKKNKRYKKIAAYFGISGTIIWGCGDLICKFFR
jgi:hypothetical protein